MSVIELCSPERLNAASFRNRVVAEVVGKNDAIVKEGGELFQHDCGPYKKTLLRYEGKTAREDGG